MTSDAENAIAAALKGADAERRDALERLAGGIAHDFRNILAVIKGNVELAMRRTDDSRVTSLLAEAERAADLGAEMTEQLLAFAQRRKAPSALLDVAAAVDDCAPLLKSACGPLVALEIEPATTAAVAAIDAIELQRVLINLVTNARDAMPGGGRTVLAMATVDTSATMELQSRSLELGRYVRIAVADSGSGMSAAVRRRAFDPFFTTKAPGQGFGLGLALARAFAIEAGGGIDIESAPGRGTIVTLYLKSR